MIDEDRDGLISFREFAQGLGIICKGETQDRMLFMYRMHVPPAIFDESPDASDSESVHSCVEHEETGSSEDWATSQSRDLFVTEEIPISVSPTARELHERRMSENTEDNSKRERVTEIPSMSQVKRELDTWKFCFFI